MSAEPQVEEPKEAEAEVQPAPEPETAPEASEPAVEPTEAAVEEKAPAVEPSEPEWPDELLERAKGAGIEDPKVLGSPEVLLGVLGRHDAKLGEIAQQAMAAATGQPATQPAVTPPQPAPGPPEAAVEVPVFRSTLTEEKRKAIADELGTEYLGELTAMTDHYTAVHGNQARELAAVQQQLQQISGSLTMQWFDREFAALGPEWEPLIGKGPTLELAQGSAEQGVRLAIKKLGDGLRYLETLESGGTPTSDSALLKRAARSVAGQKGFNPELKKAAKAVAKRAASAMPRPTGTKVAPEKDHGEAAQIEAARQWRKEHGG